MKSINNLCVVVPNWNGRDSLGDCLDSLLQQTAPLTVVVVENGSIDGSPEWLADKYPQVVVLPQPVNLGFAGGVNVGIRYAIDNDYGAVALFNNDAVAKHDWAEKLSASLFGHRKVGITTGTFMSQDKKHLDSTGDIYTNWGLPFPRGRGETPTGQYDQQTDIFGATGGASLYRVDMLKQIGLFDEDFFAYYEDVDISFRAQLAGWQTRFVPEAVAYHQIGATSSKIKGFTTYQTMKNLPWLLIKNVPARYLWHIIPRFSLAYLFFIASAIQRHQGTFAFKGVGKSLLLLPKKLWQRRDIQKSRKVSDEYIWGLITHDLPPNALKLRKLRAAWWRLTRRQP